MSLAWNAHKTESPPKRHEDPTQFIFVAVRKSSIVMRGKEFICRACSSNMAKRIASALNSYTPDRRGQ